MPEGPFGLPRLTSLGPFVEPDKIQPNHDTPPGTYGLKFIESVQPQTARDTALFLGEGRMDAADAVESLGLPVFEYKQVVLGELLSDAEFSRTLAEIVERDDREVIESIVNETSDFDETNLCAWLEFSDRKDDLQQCADKVQQDIARVDEINEKIRSSRTYFPPTIFPIDEPGDTIDGAHRIVSLSSIIGTEERIWVWELQNQDEVTRELQEMGMIR